MDKNMTAETKKVLLEIRSAALIALKQGPACHANALQSIADLTSIPLTEAPQVFEETVMEPLVIDDDLATWLSGYASGEMSRHRINVYTFEHLMAASRELRRVNQR